MKITLAILLCLLMPAAAVVHAAKTGGKSPKVQQVAPNPAAPGEILTIAGNGFGDIQGANQVLYDGQPMVVVSWANRTIEAYVPQGKTNWTYFVQVVADGAASNSAQHTINVDCQGVCTVPFYLPERWNDFSTVLSSNNCYNYANDEVTMTFAQPGRACGEQYGEISCAAVMAAALCDGLVELPDPQGACPAGTHRAHIVVAPGWDYHWYRQDDDGLWSHKPGGTPATDLDNSDELITDPEQADTGNYTDHCGYLCACGDCAEIR